jgi:hypothetical protein
MKRLGTLIFYAVGLIAIAYLLVYAYVMLAGRDLQPGAPIRIFRKPDAPSYSRIAPAPSGDIQSISVMAGLDPAIHDFFG